jgi:hypothetical protein
MKKSAILLLAMLMPLLAACGSGSLSMLSQPDTNLTATSYAAADMLLQQSQARLSQDTVLALGTLTDLKTPASTAPLGKIVSGQIGARFVQLGYNVNIPDDIGTVSAGDMPASPAAPVLKAPLEGAPAGGVSVGNVQAMITGHYVISGDNILVNLRIVDMSSGRIWGAYDYSVTMTNEIAEMARPPAAPGEKRGFFDF